jgi:two-component system sensor histidine kinase MtrB
MRRPGLRTRVTAVFAGGALLLAAALALVTYEITRHSVLQERVRTAERAAYFDAAVVRQGLTSDEVDVVAVLRALDTGQGRRPLIRRDEKWFARNADDGITSAIPARLLTLVEQGHPAVQRILVAGRPALVVGLPLRGLASDFYEVQSLTEVQGTLRTLAGTLAAVALGITLGAAALSLWLAGRALRPLTSVTRTAERIGSGDLTARMEATNDPDLTALTASFNGMVDEVGARMERERRFAADVSHELRSPLQTLTSASQVLLNRRDQLDERSRAAADLVAAEASRFTGLVQGLLELAKHETPVRLAPSDVGALVYRVAARHQLGADLVRVEPGVAGWVLDEQRVERVLDNLLDNAVKHGGEVLAVTAATADGRLRLDVDDAGPGVPPDERDLIFGRFGRGRAANARDGSDGVGLGLALVAQHVAAHGGTVTVLDRPGGGGRFRVELPQGPS